MTFTRTQTLEERFWSKVDRSAGPTACWPWLACRSRKGYGQFSIGSRTDSSARIVPAHRIAYQLEVGLIPNGKVIHHLCNNPYCQNPRHLRPTTNRFNILVGNGRAAQCSKVTHCPRGHPYTEENTYRSADGRRHCRGCEPYYRQRRRLAHARAM